MTGMLPLTARQSWKALQAHQEKIRELHLRTLFVDDATRGERMSAEAVGIYLDYSKNRVTDETLALLCRLAEESGLRERVDAMFRGEKINLTENRAVLHVALRAPKGSSIMVDGENVVPLVQGVLDKMSAFADRVRTWMPAAPMTALSAVSAWASVAASAVSRAARVAALAVSSPLSVRAVPVESVSATCLMVWTP